MVSIPARVAASLHAARVGQASSAAVVSDAKERIVVAVATMIDCTLMFVVRNCRRESLLSLISLSGVELQRS